MNMIIDAKSMLWRKSLQKALVASDALKNVSMTRYFNFSGNWEIRVAQFASVWEGQG